MSIIIPAIIIIFLLFILYFLVFKSCFLALQTVTNCRFYQLFFFSDFFCFPYKAMKQVGFTGNRETNLFDYD